MNQPPMTSRPAQENVSRQMSLFLQSCRAASGDQHTDRWGESEAAAHWAAACLSALSWQTGSGRGHSLTHILVKYQMNSFWFLKLIFIDERHRCRVTNRLIVSVEPRLVSVCSCEDLLLFFVISDSEQIIFGFCCLNISSTDPEYNQQMNQLFKN